MKKRKKTRNMTSWDYRASLLFIIPAVLSILIFLVYPFFYTLILSLGKINLMNNKLSFVGLENYINIFKSKAFIGTLFRTAKFALVVIFVSTAFGLLFAILLNQKFIGRGFGRSILILPWAIPWIVIGILWRWMLNSQFGSLNGLLFQLGIIKQYFPFLGHEESVLYVTALSAVWRQASFSAILLLASIQTIPQSLYESATIDGANLFQKFSFITLPWILPTMMIVFLLNSLYGFMQFDTVFIMTKGGPADATEIIAIHMYRRAFENLKLGEGAAIGYVLSLICLVFGLIFVAFLNKLEKKY
jgi:ABC-type sugar transport system permease subunit